MTQETLYKFFEGSATFQEKEKIMEWMETSEENKRLFFKEQLFFNSVLLLEDEKALPKRKKSITYKLNQLSKIAAVILFTLSIQYFYKQYFSISEVTTLAMQTISVPAGQRVNLTLADGTTVWLNARTTLQYPVNFGPKHRKIHLEGEGYFNVAKNEKVPFIISTNMGTVQVTGTEINVEAYSYKQNFITTLLQGSANVLSGNNPEQSFIMKPDTKVVYEDGIFSVDSIDDYNYYRWIEGLICFRNESFEAIMQEFEKYYGIRVEVVNPRVKDYFYTGKFRHTDGIDYALRVLQKDIHFNYERDDENQIMYIL